MCIVTQCNKKIHANDEAYRVLKAGGKMYVSDIVLLKPLTESQKNDVKLRGTCVLGALLKQDYLTIIRETGFAIQVIDEDRAVNQTKFNNSTLPVSSLKYIAIKPFNS
jgi:arsenite methyltransferase